jgi:two-component system, sensor histidine kinase
MDKPLILIVDDDKASRDITKLFLRDLCEIDVAEDGAKAIKMTGEKKYVAILMDIGLGREMSGLEATKRIRKIEGYESIPIVAVTAYAMKGDKEEFLKSGCTHYLSKPFESTVIKSLMNDVLSLG